MNDLENLNYGKFQDSKKIIDISLNFIISNKYEYGPDFENKEGKYQLEVSLEDQKLIPEIQQNLQAGIYNEGPLSKKYETGVAYFHDLYLTKLNLENKK